MSKFVLVEKSKMIILSDFSYWADNEQLLDEWCKDNNCKREGMIVQAQDDNAFIMFILRWT